MMGDYETHVHRRFDGSELVHTHYVRADATDHTHDYIEAPKSRDNHRKQHEASRYRMQDRYQLALRGIIPADIEKRMIDEYKVLADRFDTGLIVDMLERRYEGPL